MFPTTLSARRSPVPPTRAGALAAALAAALVGCPVPGGDRTLPAVPTVQSVTLLQAGQATALAWSGAPARVQVAVRGLDGAVGPLRLSATRSATLAGGATSGPEIAAAVQGAAGDAPQVIALDLPAGDLLPGTWRVALHDARGLLASLDEAFLVALPPVVAGVDRPAACTTPASRTVTLRGANFLTGPASLGVPRVIAVLVTPLGELPMGAPTGSDCVDVRLGDRWFRFCQTLLIPLPDQPAAIGEVVLRHPRDVAPPPGGPLAALITYEAEGWVTAVAGRLAVVDAPAEVKVMSNGQYLVGAASGTSARIGQTALALRGEGCQPAGVAGVERCEALWATIPQGFPAGSHTVEVASHTGCALGTPVVLAARPVITGTTPAAVCRAGSRHLTLLGEGLDFVRTAFAPSATGPWTGFSTQDPSRLPIGRWAIRAETSDTSPMLASDPWWIEVFAGPLAVAETPRPALISSVSHRPVTLWVSGATGLVSGRLHPRDGGDPVPVALAASPGGASLFTFEFPALGGDRDYDIEVSDESPCGSRSTQRPLRTRADPVLLAWDFDVAGAAPGAYDATLSWLPALQPAVTSGAGLTGAAATARSDADLGDWSLGWFPHVELGDPGLLRFDLKASGAGVPAGARRLRLRVVDANLRRFDLLHELPPPVPGAWTRYELRLDDPAGWTTRAWNVPERPSVREDFQAELEELLVPAGWWAGPVEVAVDDLVIELATDPVVP